MRHIATLLVFLAIGFRVDCKKKREIRLSFNLTKPEKIPEAPCSFVLDLKEELGRIQHVLVDKAKLQVSFILQPQLLTHLDEGRTVAGHEIEIKVESKGPKDLVHKLGSCKLLDEILRIVSDQTKEDLSYFGLSNDQTSYPTTTFDEIGETWTCDAEASCTAQTLRSIIAQPIAFESEDERQNQLSSLSYISEHAYHEIIEGGEVGSLAFIGYFMPGGPKSMGFLEVMTQIASRGGEVRVYLISCKVFRKLCEREGATPTPQLKAFLDGKLYKAYDGLVNVKSIKNWLKMLDEPELYHPTEKEVEKFREGIMPNTRFENEVQEAITVGFFADNESPEYEEFLQTAHDLHGEYHFGVFQHGDIAKWAHNPVVFTFKPNEIKEKVAAWYPGSSQESMSEFVAHSSVPSIVILNEENLEYIPEDDKPLVTLVLEKGQPASLKEDFFNLASGKSNRQLMNFGYIEINDENLVGLRFLQTMKLRKSLLPALLVTQLSKCNVRLEYLYPEITKVDLKLHIKSILAENTEPHLCLLPQHIPEDQQTKGESVKTEL